MSKGSAHTLPFFQQNSQRVFFTLMWNVVRPKQADETAFFGLSFGPNELPSVALLQGRLGLVGKSMGRIGRMRGMGLSGKVGMEKSRVRLFRNL